MILFANTICEINCIVMSKSNWCTAYNNRERSPSDNSHYIHTLRAYKFTDFTAVINVYVCLVHVTVFVVDRLS